VHHRKQTVASRYLLDLSDKQRTGKDGFGLVLREQDPAELRKNIKPSCTGSLGN
jgi:hypothetical protein